MLEEEAQHFLRCVRPLRIGVGARGAASRPRVPSAVDAPVLEYSAPARVGMDGARIGMTTGDLSAMHVCPRARGSDRLRQDFAAIAWMHGRITIAVKHDGRNSRPVTWTQWISGPAALSHGDKGGRKIHGGATCEPRMNADCRV